MQATSEKPHKDACKNYKNLFFRSLIVINSNIKRVTPLIKRIGNSSGKPSDLGWATPDLINTKLA